MRIRGFLATVVMCVFIGVGSRAHGEVIDYLDPVDLSLVKSELARLDSVEVSLASLRRQVDSAKGGGKDHFYGYDEPCPSSGLVMSAEFIATKPHRTLGTGMRVTGTGGLVDTTFEPAYRIMIGHQWPSGIGIRFRYWEFDQAFEDPEPSLGAGGVNLNNWDVFTGDVELFDTIPISCNASLTWSIGYRYASYEEQLAQVNNAGLAGDGSMRVASTGSGLIVGAGIKRSLTNCVGFFADVSSTVVFGDELTTGERPTIPRNIVIDANDTKWIYEARAGIEWTKECHWDGELFVRAGAEVQYWSVFGVDSPFGGSLADLANEGSSVGFAGALVAGGITR